MVGTVAGVSVRMVHLVAKTHLDLGFTALAAEVEQQYLEDFFPRAISVAGALRARGGAEQLAWTTGSWILHRALHQGDPDRAAAVDAAVRAGDLAWHALPLTTHTELMDAALFRTGLGISRELDERFGRTTTAAKMTDVPGHTRAMVPLLAEAGVTFLHLGVNPAWPVPDVPPVFRWRSPGGAEVVVAYQAGGYGGEIVVPGCDEALAFLHSGDNLGPPSVDDVLGAHASLRASHPQAEIRGSTLDGFARALAASGAVEALPVVTAEIGDPWLFGAGSDPQKLAVYRELLWTRGTTGMGRRLSAGERRSLDHRLLLVAEHTWGLDQKVALPGDRRWDAAGLAAVRASEGGRRFEASWAEQRAYVDDAVYEFERAIVPHLTYGSGPPDLTRARPAGDRVVGTVSDRAIRGGPVPPDIPDHPQAGYRRVGRGGRVPDPPGAVVDGFDPPEVRAARFADGEGDVDGGPDTPESHWDIGISPSSGAIDRLVHRPTGRVLADAHHPLGLVVHQGFGEADYERFYAQLTPEPVDEDWARWDNTKPGIDACGAVSARWTPTTEAVWESSRHDHWWRDIVVRTAFPAAAVAHGAPPEVWHRWWLSTEGDEIEHSVWWADRAACRLPSATWCSYVPVVSEPERWELDKLGQRVSPLDVVRRGGRALHAVGEGMHYSGPDGRLTITTRTAPLVAPGAPNLLDADPPLPDLAGGFHVLLHDNCWGTNFPMWNEGPATFDFTISVA